MKTVYKILLGVLLVIIILVIYVNVAGNKKFDAPYPDIKASNDPEIIARGEYLVFGPAHCATCHVPMDKIFEVEEGLKMPLVGGWGVDIPPASLRASNITPDEETGIGRLSDAEIARTLRHGIGHDGRYILPVMPYSQMSDEDIQAIISYLRYQPAVHNPIEKTKYSFLGKALLAFGILKPNISDIPPPPYVNREDTIAYGAYVAMGVANCMGCHTNMDLMTGEFTSEPFSGGFYFEPDDFTMGYSYVSPNLTPEIETGIMANWTEEVFLTRFKGGRIHKYSPMPWGAFSRIDTFELKAIYRYLQSLEPVHHPIEQIVFEPGEKMK